MTDAATGICRSQMSSALIGSHTQSVAAPDRKKYKEHISNLIHCLSHNS